MVKNNTNFSDELKEIINSIHTTKERVTPEDYIVFDVNKNAFRLEEITTTLQRAIYISSGASLREDQEVIDGEKRLHVGKLISSVSTLMKEPIEKQLYILVKNSTGGYNGTVVFGGTVVEITEEYKKYDDISNYSDEYSENVIIRMLYTNEILSTELSKYSKDKH